jgi:response regulator RpfG family c-di-GMP phosphodiesterase
MSPTEDLDMVYQCLKAGADHYILKPLKEEHLKNLTQNVYRKKQEAEVLNMLKSEKNRTNELQEKTEKLENEVEALKSVHRLL